MSQLVAATGPILQQILDETHKIWHEGLARVPYTRLWTAQLATPWGRDRLERWALVDGHSVLASAKIYHFDAVLDGRSVRVAGLGAVFTQPEYRGRGAARELIERLLEAAVRDGADLALLFSEIGPEYYARLGFEALPLEDLALRIIEDDRRGAPATMVRSGHDRDLDDVVAMDGVRAELFRFHLKRDRDVVSYAIVKKRLLSGLGPMGARELQFFVAEEGASAAAYVVIDVKNDVWTIDSCGDRDPSGARLGAILQVLIAREPTRQRPKVKAWLPATLRPPQIQIVDASPSRDVMMIRPLSERGRPSSPLGAADVLYWRGDEF